MIGPYIVDFICFDKKLIIELDGGQHNEASRIKQDKKRTAWLLKQKYFVLRFWNNEVFTNLDGVLEQIMLALAHPHPNPPPSRGRESL